ncbi:MAG: YPDG domain-containing protein, partial [Corynebacterium sp.]|nr:YPDG domain-containing protein [Corynebacterium sp.]
MNKSLRRRGIAIASAVAMSITGVTVASTASAQEAATGDGVCALTEPPADPAAPGDAEAPEGATEYPGIGTDNVYKSVNNQVRFVFTDQKPDPKLNAIESPGNKDTIGRVAGYVGFQQGGTPITTQKTAAERFIPMEGVRVYAQWKEKDGTTSPIYTTTTNSNGEFWIKMVEFTRADGSTAQFDADVNAPELEKVRVWADNPKDDSFQKLWEYRNGYWAPDSIVIDTTGTVTWGVGQNRVDGVKIAFGDRTENSIMHLDTADEVPYARIGTDLDAQGTVKGEVHWEQNQSSGAQFWSVINNPGNGGDVPATDVPVYGSYLSDYAVARIMGSGKDMTAEQFIAEFPDLAQADGTMKETGLQAMQALGFDGDSIRGGGWNQDWEARLQNWIHQQMAAEGKDLWIGETVTAKTDSKGEYVLQFRGTWGRWWEDNGTNFQLIAMPADKQDRLHTVAQEPTQGDWASGTGPAYNDGKHINIDWLYVSTAEMPGIGQITPYYRNQYAPANQTGTGVTWAGQYFSGLDYVKHANFGLFSETKGFDVLTYNTFGYFAVPGDTVENTTWGLPNQFVNGLEYQIEWVDADGKVVATSASMAAQPDGTLPSFPMTVPADLDKTTDYIANLYVVDNGKREGAPILSDSFTAYVGYMPKYKDQTGAPGTELTAPAPLFDNTTTDEVETVAGDKLDNPVTGYALPDYLANDPDCVDQITVDPTTGAVSYTFPADTEEGTTVTVPVVATFQDGTKAAGSVTFTTDDPQSSKVDPTAPGTADADGNVYSDPEKSKIENRPTVTLPETLPEGVTIDSIEVEGLPAGLTASADGRTASGTLTEDVPAEGKVYPVKVTVTYGDGTTD